MAQSNESNPVGRPTKYTPELGERLAVEIASGTSVKSLCENETWTPGQKTFYVWLYKHPEFRQKYEEAKEAQALWAAELIEEIADNATPEEIQVAKLRVDTRKWTSSRLLPKKYGDRQTVDNTSSDGSMTPTKIERIIIRPGDDTENTTDKNS
jgi:hypothetical protein